MLRVVVLVGEDTTTVIAETEVDTPYGRFRITAEREAKDVEEAVKAAKETLDAAAQELVRRIEESKKTIEERVRKYGVVEVKVYDATIIPSIEDKYQVRIYAVEAEDDP